MRAIIIGTFLLATVSVQAQDFAVTEDRLLRFELYTACAPVRLFVRSLPPPAADIGLTKQAITATVRSRLRGARIYTAEESGLPELDVGVNVLGLAFSISFQLHKAMLDLETDIIGTAVTWQNRGTGTHGRDSGYILQGIGRYTDEFIDQYLAVNESACE